MLDESHRLSEGLINLGFVILGSRISVFVFKFLTFI